MKVIVTIYQGYMGYANVYKYDLSAYERFVKEVKDVHDAYHDFDKDLNSLSYTSDSGNQVFMVDIVGAVINKKECYVVCAFQSWSILPDKAMVFSSKKKAQVYYDSLRRESPEYDRIIEEDGDKDNFLDDDDYAVFIEKATIYK